MLRECLLATMCHMSGITCHVSCVLFHVSRVMCHVSHVNYFYLFYYFGQSGGGSRWRVCYQGSLHHLVFNQICFVTL